MAILNSVDLLNVNNFLNQLGLNGWQLQEGSYNGYTFTVAQSPFSLNGLVTNLSSLGQAGTLVGYAAQIANAGAMAVGAVNPLTKIPGGANSVSSTIVDTFSRKVAIQELPNGKDNIRSLGYNGNELIVMGVAWGANYMSFMNNNLVQMFYSDEAVAIDPKRKANYHVLQHPIFGIVQNCWLLNMRVIHNSAQWRSCMFELRFRTERPVVAIPNTFNQILQQINNVISGILSIANALVGTWGTLEAITNGNAQTQTAASNNIFVQNSLIDSQEAVLDSVNNSVVATQLLVTNLAPPNYSNTALSNYATTSPSVTQFSYFQDSNTPNDVQNLNTNLVANINTAIATIYSGVFPNNFYDTVDNLKGLIAQIGQLSILLLNTYYGQVTLYTAPYDMSLFTMCSLNGIDYQSNYQKIIQLNQNTFFWLNLIPKGITIALPLSGAGTSQ